MRVFNCVCIDNETGYEMVAEDLNYNNACWLIQSIVGNKEPKTEKLENDVYKFSFENISFIYDEVRLVLMKKVG